MKIDVCIPTRNRLNFLKETVGLWQTVVQSQKVADFRICVADGGSSDGTQDWLEKNSNNLVVYQGTSDYAGRLVQFIRNSEADFVWFFGDDDLLLADQLPQVIRVLQTQSAGVYVVNYSTWDKSFSRVECENAFEHSLLDSEGWPGLGQRLGFLSILILNRRLANQLPLEKWSNIAPSWPHVPWILALADRHGIKVIEQPTLRQRGGASLFGTETGGWYEPFVCEWSRVCAFGVKIGLTKRKVEVLLKAPFYEKNLTFRRILGERLRGYGPTADQLWKMLRLYSSDWRFLFSIFLPALIPGFVYRSARSCYRFCFGK